MKLSKLFGKKKNPAEFERDARYEKLDKLPFGNSIDLSKVDLRKLDEKNFRDFQRLSPLFEEAAAKRKRDYLPLVRLYAPDPSKGAVSPKLRGLHLIVVAKEDENVDGEGNEVRLMEDFELLVGVRATITASITEEDDFRLIRYSIKESGAEVSPVFTGGYKRPKDYVYDSYSDKCYFPEEVLDKVVFHPERQMPIREDLYKFDNAQFDGKTRFHFFGGSKYRGRVNGKLADFFIKTDQVRGKEDKNEMWYFLHKINDRSLLYNSGRAHMRMSDDGQSVVVDLSLDGTCVVDARDYLAEDEEGLGYFLGDFDVTEKDLQARIAEVNGGRFSQSEFQSVVKAFESRRQGEQNDESMQDGTVRSTEEGSGDGSDEKGTSTCDGVFSLDAVAKKLGKERLETCNHIIEGVLRGEKKIVEIIYNDDITDLSGDVCHALADTLRSRRSGTGPSVVSYKTEGCFQWLCEDRAEEYTWLARIDEILNNDLVILHTPEWFTEMVNYAKSSEWSRETIAGYRKFLRLLRSRMESEGKGRTYITLRFPRWRFPGARWVERMLCKRSNRIWHADLEFCEGTKETCSSH